MNWQSFAAGAALATVIALFRAAKIILNAKAHHYRLVKWHTDSLTKAVDAIRPHLTDPRDAELINVFLAAVERSAPAPAEPSILELLQ